MPLTTFTFSLLFLLFLYSRPRLIDNPVLESFSAELSPPPISSPAAAKTAALFLEEFIHSLCSLALPYSLEYQIRAPSAVRVRPSRVRWRTFGVRPAPNFIASGMPALARRLFQVGATATLLLLPLGPLSMAEASHLHLRDES